MSNRTETLIALRDYLPWVEELRVGHLASTLVRTHPGLFQPNDHPDNLIGAIIDAGDVLESDVEVSAEALGVPVEVFDLGPESVRRIANAREADRLAREAAEQARIAAAEQADADRVRDQAWGPLTPYERRIAESD